MGDGGITNWKELGSLKYQVEESCLPMRNTPVDYYVGKKFLVLSVQHAGVYVLEQLVIICQLINVFI